MERGSMYTSIEESLIARTVCLEPSSSPASVSSAYRTSPILSSNTPPCFPSSCLILIRAHLTLNSNLARIRSTRPASTVVLSTVGGRGLDGPPGEEAKPGKAPGISSRLKGSFCSRTRDCRMDRSSSASSYASSSSCRKSSAAVVTESARL